MRSELPVVTPRSKTHIEKIALELLERHLPDCVEDPGPVPIARYAEFLLPTILPIEFGVDGFLPPSVEAITVPAQPDRMAQLLLSEQTYAAPGRHFSRARFTTAHEVGHAHLHLVEVTVDLAHGRLVGLCRTGAIPFDQNPERQANQFAAALLMPASAVRRAAKILGPNPSALADTFRVSLQSMQIRMGELRIC